MRSDTGDPGGRITEGLHLDRSSNVILWHMPISIRERSAWILEILLLLHLLKKLRTCDKWWGVEIVKCSWWWHCSGEKDSRPLIGSWAEAKQKWCFDATKLARLWMNVNRRWNYVEINVKETGNKTTRSKRVVVSSRIRITPQLHLLRKRLRHFLTPPKLPFFTMFCPNFLPSPPSPHHNQQQQHDTNINQESFN